MARSRKPRRKANRPRPKAKAAARKTARKRSKPVRRPKARHSKPRKAAKRSAARRPVRRATSTAANLTPPFSVLRRIRRLLGEEERMGAAAAARQGDHLNASAVSGRQALRRELSEHTESSPTLTAGDVDARWQDAYAVGDEAPGGDNPTPDQDRVDDIGRALGIEYGDGEELRGGEEVLERDRHRWDK